MVTTYNQKNEIRSAWSQYIGNSEWHIVGTTTYFNPTYTKRNRTLMEQTFNSISSITQMFFVSEYSGFSKNVHSHFLIHCDNPLNTIVKLKKKFDRLGKNQIELVINDPVMVNETGTLKVGYYFTKHIENGIDYDILIK
jgi:hypothetical protein